MARVALITTGAMEELALQKSLERMFPEHEFIAPKRLDGFTSSRLPPDYASLRQRRPLLNIEKFAKTLIGRIAGGRRDEPRADFVIGIEDMELCNADCPANITGALRDAVAQNLEQWADGPKRERLRLALGERCSFHLMTPMTEAYFFADPDALARATGPGLDHPNLFDPSSCDIEGFHVEDTVYLDTPTVPKAHRERHDWRVENRQGHPKSYLAYLTDPQLDGKARYTETKHGAEALASLEWPNIVLGGRRPAVARFARSLIADLVDMLGTPERWPDLGALELDECHPLTWPPARDTLLRNL